MSGKHIENNSDGNSKIPGSLSGRIAKTLIYGKAKQSAIDSEIGKMKEALSDLVQKVKTGKNWIEKKRQARRKK